MSVVFARMREVEIHLVLVAQKVQPLVVNSMPLPQTAPAPWSFPGDLLQHRHYIVPLI